MASWDDELLFDGSVETENSASSGESEQTSDDFNFDDMFDGADSGVTAPDLGVSEQSEARYEEQRDVGSALGSSDDFDFDSAFAGEDAKGQVTQDEIVIDVDLDKYENMADSGAPIVLALVSGKDIVYLAHGTQGKLAPTIKFMEKAVGTALVQIPLGDEDIEALSKDAKQFSSYYKKFVEA